MIHAYYVTPLAFVGVYAGRTLGVPTIVSARGNDLDRAVFDPAKSAQILYALATRGCDHGQLARSDPQGAGSGASPIGDPDPQRR